MVIYQKRRSATFDQIQEDNLSTWKVDRWGGGGM